MSSSALADTEGTPTKKSKKAEETVDNQTSPTNEPEQTNRTERVGMLMIPPEFGMEADMELHETMERRKMGYTARGWRPVNGSKIRYKVATSQYQPQQMTNMESIGYNARMDSSTTTPADQSVQDSRTASMSPASQLQA
jgi:hypothetical protein